MQKQKGLEKITGTFDNTKFPAILDGEFEPDYSQVKKCEECDSFNISFESNGVNICRECGHKSGTASMVNFQKMAQGMMDKERNSFEERVNQGETFGLD